MIALGLNQLQKYYGATMVLEDITFEVHIGEKIGIVGSNGCGKSTLLKIIMGIEGYEKGMLSIRKGATLAYLEQMPIYPESFKVMDVLNAAFKEVDIVYKELQLLEKQLAEIDQLNMEQILNKYSKLQSIYENLGGYEKEERLSKVCTGLKISNEFKEKRFSQLSGGEKTTVILGKILLENPDVLLLDEPSNHLDFDAMEWLESYLREYKGSIIIVSHDRYFLDNVVTRIVEIEDMRCTSYNGNYTYFAKEKERQLQLQLHAFLQQEKKIKTMERSISQLRDWGTRSDNNKFFKRASSMQKLLNKLERIDKPTLEQGSISIQVKTTNRSGNDVIVVDDLCKRYGEKVLLYKAQMLIRNGESIALIGANGCGKSTMIKILLGMEKADGGIALLGSSIKLGYLPQVIIFQDENKTILECFKEDVVMTEGKAREYLAKYMFFGESVWTKVGKLSGGERSRLKLAMLMYHDVNLLILDEPTNHLDIGSREELEGFLKEFKGTLLFVSHDRYFINNIASRVVELSRGRLISYNGNYEYYKEKSMQEKNRSAIKTIPYKNKTIKVKEEKTYNPIKSSNNKWQAQKIEEEIEKIEGDLKLIEEQINKFTYDYEKLNALYNDKLEIESNIEKLMEEYLNQ